MSLILPSRQQHKGQKDIERTICHSAGYTESLIKYRVSGMMDRNDGYHRHQLVYHHDLHQQNNEQFKRRQLTGTASDVVSQINYWPISDKTSLTTYHNLHSRPLALRTSISVKPESTREGLEPMNVTNYTPHRQRTVHSIQRHFSPQG